MADYYTNTSKYAKNCVNKAKPKMHCNGKCQMMKKLQEEEKKDQEKPERKGENKGEVILSSKSFFAIVCRSYNIAISNQLFSHVTDSYTYNCTKSIFQPPKV